MNIFDSRSSCRTRSSKLTNPHRMFPVVPSRRESGVSVKKLALDRTRLEADLGDRSRTTMDQGTISGHFLLQVSC